MGVTISVVRGAVPTATGNDDITGSLGGLTGKAGFHVITRGQTDGTVASHANLGFGAATDTDERWAMCTFSENNLATTDTGRRGMTDECIMIAFGGSAGVDGEADHVSFIANGERVNYGNAPANGYLLMSNLFAGTDLTAKAGTFTAADAVAATVDVNTVGFEPDVVIMASIGFAMGDAALPGLYYSFGAAINNVAEDQACWFYRSVDAAANGQVAGRITNSYATGQYGTAGYIWAGEIGSFDAGGFTCTTREGASGGADDVAYLALAFGGTMNFSLDILDTPVATGAQSVTAPGFQPDYVLLGLTQMPAIDTHYTDANAGVFGAASFDGTNEYCQSVAEEDTADPTDTQSLSDDTAINLPQDDGSAGHVAAFTAFDSDGWDWNFSATLGTAKKMWALAIGEVAAAGQPMQLRATTVPHSRQWQPGAFR